MGNSLIVIERILGLMKAREVPVRCAMAFLMFGAVVSATAHSAQAQGGEGVAIKTTVEVETKVFWDGRTVSKWVPADELVPGDEVIYTLEIRNPGTTALRSPHIDYAIPKHLRYVENTAVGAGADVSFSVDGGHSFDRPENLRVAEPAGALRPATAAEYTHIRWQLRHTLKAKSVAFAHFRAVVQ
jgi:uncharacterized repeat protein (TIGR01451 family)